MSSVLDSPLPETARAPAALTVNGATLVPEPSGALWWPARETLIVADLHLEKGSAYAQRGQLLPPYDTAATLERLAQALRRRQPKRVVCLGDSFHDQEAAERLAPQARSLIRALAVGLDWIWIAGNHDPAPPPDLGGRVEKELVEGGLVFRHEALEMAGSGELSGHFHPKARVKLRARGFSARCFVGDGRRLVLPAFGAFAGGLDVLSPTVRRLFPKGFEVALLAKRGVYRFPADMLVPIA